MTGGISRHREATVGGNSLAEFLPIPLLLKALEPYQEKGVKSYSEELELSEPTIIYPLLPSHHRSFGSGSGIE